MEKEIFNIEILDIRRSMRAYFRHKRYLLGIIIHEYQETPCIVEFNQSEWFFISERLSLSLGLASTGKIYAIAIRSKKKTSYADIKMESPEKYVYKPLTFFLVESTDTVNRNETFKWLLEYYTKKGKHKFHKTT